MATTKQV